MIGRFYCNTDYASVIVQLRWPKRLLYRHYTGIYRTSLEI